MRHFIIALLSFVLSAVTGAMAQNTVTFDNQSGEPALVKLIGPTLSEVEVPKGTKQTVNASAGRYIIKVRYGLQKPVSLHERFRHTAAVRPTHQWRLTPAMIENTFAATT